LSLSVGEKPPEELTYKTDYGDSRFLVHFTEQQQSHVWGEKFLPFCKSGDSLGKSAYKKYVLNLSEFRGPNKVSHNK
jgi:hypothetical protein